MAPAETTVLSNFLITPAALHKVISIQAFINLFPEAHRSRPQVKHLFYELQHQRDQSIDNVRQNIIKEVKKGQLQRKRVAKARKQAARGEPVTMDATISVLQSMVR